MEISRLSDRELELLYLTKQGFCSKEIAVRINIAKTTVDQHFKNINKKLNVASRFQAVAEAEKQQLI